MSPFTLQTPFYRAVGSISTPFSTFCDYSFCFATHATQKSTLHAPAHTAARYWLPWQPIDEDLSENEIVSSSIRHNKRRQTDERLWRHHQLIDSALLSPRNASRRDEKRVPIKCCVTSLSAMTSSIRWWNILVLLQICNFRAFVAGYIFVIGLKESNLKLASASDWLALWLDDFGGNEIFSCLMRLKCFRLSTNRILNKIKSSNCQLKG